MKPYIKIRGNTYYDGEYSHYGSALGLFFSYANFTDDDNYYQISIGLIFFCIEIGIR